MYADVHPQITMTSCAAKVSAIKPEDYTGDWMSLAGAPEGSALQLVTRYQRHITHTAHLYLLADTDDLSLMISH